MTNKQINRLDAHSARVYVANTLGRRNGCCFPYRHSGRPKAYPESMASK